MNWTKEGNLLCGTQKGIELMNSALQLLNANQIGDCWDVQVCPKTGKTVVMTFENNKVYLKCSNVDDEMKKIWRKDVSNGSLTHFSVSPDHIVVIDSVKKVLKVFTDDAHYLYDIDCSSIGCVNPKAVYIQSSSSLLIADETGLYQTTFEKTPTVEWMNPDVKMAAAISVNKKGLVFVANSTTELTVISPEGQQLHVHQQH